jgi:hypothetical protein
MLVSDSFKPSTATIDNLQKFYRAISYLEDGSAKNREYLDAIPRPVVHAYDTGTGVATACAVDAGS